MADYVLSAKGTYDGSSFDKGVENSKSKLSGFMEQAKEVGQKVKSAIGTGMVRAADAITSSVGSIGAAVGALALQGGISRALNIEQAQYKMKQMGMDVDTVMASVKESVSGTKFGLDVAATSATMLGTSGVAAGEDMTRALKSAAGVATISGDSMEDIAAIFSKVAAKGKVSGDELLQLNERGINATDALAKSLGKTQDEVRQMVSKGQIDFQTFSDAMYSTFGEAAAGANDTFSGAMANVRAALSRTGEAFATPALGALQQVFAALIPVINAANAALAPLAESFAEFVNAHLPQIVEWIGSLKDKIEGLGEGGFANLSTKAKLLAAAIGVLSVGSMGGLISQIPIVGGALGGLFGTLGKLATPVGSLVKGLGAVGGVLGGLSAPMIAIVALVALLVGSFVAMMATNDEFRASVMGIVESIGASLAPVIQSFVDNVLPALQSLMEAIVPVLASIVEFALLLASAVAQALAPALEALMPIIAQIIDIITQVVEVIGAILTPVIEGITGFITEHMEEIRGVVTTVAQGIADFIHSVLDVISRIVNVIMLAVQGDWGGAWEAIKSVASDVWNGIKSVVSGAANTIASAVSSLVGKVTGFFGDMFSKARATVSNMWSNVKTAFSNGVNSAVSFVGGLPKRIMSLFANAGSWLYNSGQSIIVGLVDGIMGAINWAVGQVSGALGWIRDLFPFSPAKDGPFSGKGWVLYSGMSIMDALAEGAESQLGRTVRSFEGVAGRVRDSLELGEDIYAQKNYGASVSYQHAATGDKGQNPAPGLLGGLSISIGEMVVRDRDDADYFAEVLFRKISREVASAL